MWTATGWSDIVKFLRLYEVRRAGTLARINTRMFTLAHKHRHTHKVLLLMTSFFSTQLLDLKVFNTKGTLDRYYFFSVLRLIVHVALYKTRDTHTPTPTYTLCACKHLFTVY